jgi:plasmanylethanolamine desaturase
MAILEAALVILLADGVSGIVHWAEDTFWVERTPVLGRWIVQPNVLHHRNGSAFVQNTWLQSSWDLLAVGVLILVVAWRLDALTWHVWLFVAVGANANQIHKWNHMRRAELPRPVRLLQRLRLLQSASDHAAHHRGDKNAAYCVVTPFVNPLLDRVGFWRSLERALVPLFGAPRREDLRP